jgi:hypothetical protein
MRATPSPPPTGAKRWTPKPGTDLVLADLMMLNVDGRNSVLVMQNHPGTAVILMTGYGTIPGVEGSRPVDGVSDQAAESGRTFRTFESAGRQAAPPELSACAGSARGGTIANMGKARRARCHHRSRAAVKATV